MSLVFLYVFHFTDLTSVSRNDPPANRVFHLYPVLHTLVGLIILMHPWFLIYFSLIPSTYPPIHCRCRGLLLHLITHKDKHALDRTLGRTPWTRDRPVAEASTYTTHNIHKRQTSMLPAGLKPAIPASERPQTYSLDRVATGIGSF
jgi:hypothetical protein